MLPQRSLLCRMTVCSVASALLLSGPLFAEGDLKEAASLQRTIVPSPLPADGTISFAASGVQAIKFRRTPSSPAPEAPWEQYTALLESAQRQDMVAAEIVGTLLVHCATARGVAFWTDDPGPLRVREHRSPPSGSRSAVDQFCAERTNEELASGLGWLKEASAAGNATAMQRLSRLYRTGTDQHFAVLDAMWQQGSITALHKLAIAYRYRSGGPAAQPDDATKALAFAWLHVRLNESAFREHSTQSDFLEALRKNLARQTEAAGPDVQARAINLARSILAQNARCCAVP